MTKHSIYALCEPNSTKIRYVGKTSAGLTYRLAQHVVDAGLNQDSGRPVIQWIRRLAEDRRMPEIILLAECSKDEASEKERQFIVKYSKEYALLNMTGNGEDWDNRHTITMPKEIADFVINEAKSRNVPVYQLVIDAVKLYVRVNPLDKQQEPA